MPELSIIIPTFNRARFLLETVRQVLGQEFSDFELWVIDQSSEAQSAQIAEGLRAWRQDTRLRYLRLSSAGVANARNEGIVRAAGRIVMFLDDDVILLRDDFVRAHVEAYADPAVGGVTGRTVERVNNENCRRPANRITAGGRTLVNLRGQERCEIHTLKGANMSVRAEAIRLMGGFDRNYTGTALLEEADFSERIRKRGWRLMFEPRAELLHLSAPAGGVRVANTRQTDYFRFRSTAYFVRKHRGRLGLLPFGLTHLLVALVRTAKTRNPKLPLDLARGVQAGLDRWRAGADEALPSFVAPALAVQAPALPAPTQTARTQAAADAA
jgi:glycosyltransferase involved in cell wall biosynthesis